MYRRTPQLLCVALVSGLLALAALLLSSAFAGNPSAGAEGLPPAAPKAPLADITLPVAEAAYTDQGDAAANFGGLAELHAGTNEKGLTRRFIYLKFNLSAIPPGSTLSVARLRVFQQSGSGPEPYAIWSWSVPNTWTETGITWNNQPWPANPSGPPAGVPLGGGWQEWDVGPIVEGWLAGGTPYGIALAGDNATVADHLFDGRTGKSPPELYIQYKPPDTPTPTDTPTPKDSPTPTETVYVKPTNTHTPSVTPSRTPSVTPSLTPSRTPSRTPSPTASPSATWAAIPDIRIIGMEITQGMQNLQNQMPLMRWRETRARAYIFSTSPVPNVRARLRAFRENGTEILPAQDAQWPVSTHAGAVDRLNLRDGFYFYVPVAWREGVVRFRLEVNPGNLITETNYANNTLEQRIEFYPGNYDEAIVARPFSGGTLQGHTYDIRDPLIQTDLLQNTRRYFPTLRLFTMGNSDPMREPFWCSFDHGYSSSGRNCLSARVSWWADTTSDDYPHQHYLGLAHVLDDFDGVLGMGGIGDQHLWVKPSPSGFPAWYVESGASLVHELGHNHGLLHMNCTGAEENGHPEWMDFGYPWPHPNCRLAEVDVWGYYGLDIQHAVANVPGPVVITNNPAGPEYNRAFPFMGYRNPAWISPYEMCDLLPTNGIPCSLYFPPGSPSSPDEAAQARAMKVYADPAKYAPPDLVAELTEATDYLRVHGRVWRDGKSAELWHVLRTTQPVQKALQVAVEQLGKQAALPLAPNVPSVTLEQLDAGGAVLASKPIYVSDVTEPVEWLSFVELVPRAAGAVRVQISSDGLPLAERGASASAPTVTLLTPNGGIVQPGDVVEWQASDADGDKLYYDVLFTPDNGATWQPIAQDVDGTSTPINIVLKGTQQGRIAVIAMDGFWTSTVQSAEPLTVANNAPQPLITSPGDGDAFAPGDLVVLTGQAYDPEDITLPDAQLAWSVSPGGVQGTGGELPIYNLPPGLYTITLSATDTEGLTASDSITIEVGKKLYLPLLLRR